MRGARINGINVDDAGDKANPARGIRIEHCSVVDTGGRGNHDALKLSGVDQFVVRGCHFEGWGGSGIDMVGCHDGLIEASCLPENLQPKDSQAPKAGSTLAEIEARIIYDTLKRNRGKKLVTAKELGIDKTTLWLKIKKLRIKLPEA